ncbi:MAG: site-specific integrase [Chloroflexi bacterium]|nr:site-specific integrase [Chloroflexota bacterium]
MIQPTRARIDQTLAEAIQGFIRSLEAKNRSGATITAYRRDLTQFASWLAENNVTADRPERIERVDVEEFLAHLGARPERGTTGRVGRPGRMKARID